MASFGARSVRDVDGALAFLVIDPRSRTACRSIDRPSCRSPRPSVLLAWALSRGRTIDVILAGLALGLTLGAKHTGLIVGVAVASSVAVAVFKRKAVHDGGVWASCSAF